MNYLPTLSSRFLTGIIATFAIASSCFIFSGCNAFPIGGKPKEDPSIPVKVDPVLFRTEIFGEESSQPINNGYFIYKGRYIPPPYVIRRAGLSLHINDIMVIAPMKWKSINEKVPEKLPEIPDIGMWSDGDMTTEFINDTFSYYEFIYKGPTPPQDRTILAAIADHVRKLPNVWNTEVDEERQLIKITLCNFTKFNVSSSSVFGLQNAGITEESLRNMYHRAFEKHIDFFKDNKIVYKGLKISEIEWRENIDTWYEASKILNSDSWKSSKRKSLEKIDFGSEKIINDLLASYKYSKELEKRLYEEYVKTLDNVSKKERTTPYDKFK
ncbi:MAG TPA: hypothetical protein DCZ94_21035 [Lentisphaeria bacterium]|nr:MAG: hypothetical protein A2X48_23240 [Lentisphaerae bacterium GWF2_49_21]HBC89430.1 hypothetical protein [Lentisphaeria bacterium]